jgi:hypothetical protein
MQWYLLKDGSVHGPFAESQLLTWLAQGQLPAQALACPAGQQQWSTIASWPIFAQTLPRTPQPPSPLPPAAPGSQHWPQPVNTSVATNRGETQRNRYSPEILELAQAHKQFTIGIGIILVLLFLVFNLLANSNLWILGLLLLVAKCCLAFYLTFKLATALRTTGATFWLVFSIIPILGDLALVILSRQATNKLTAAGISVGFFGPNMTL